MEECAVTLNDLGLTGELARAVAAVQRRQGRAGADKAAEGLASNVQDALRRRQPVKCRHK